MDVRTVLSDEGGHAGVVPLLAAGPEVPGCPLRVDAPDEAPVQALRHLPPVLEELHVATLVTGEGQRALWARK